MADYDEIIPGIFLGNIYSTKDYKFLHLNNIKYVLSLTNNYVQLDKKKIKHLQFNVNDTPLQDLISIFGIAGDFIDDAQKRNFPIYIHCDMGISRSSTTLIAYLMKKWRKSYEEVYNFVRRRRNVIYPNFGFQAQLKLYEKMGYNIVGNSVYHKLFKKFTILDQPHNIMRFNVQEYLKFLTKRNPGSNTYNPTVSYTCDGPAYTGGNRVTYQCVGKYY